MMVMWRMLWVLIAGLATHFATATTTIPTVIGNYSKPRSLDIENRQDVTSYQGYYPYPGPYPGPPPTYGPPPIEPPTGTVQIEFAFDEIILRCVAEEPFEHIIWIRYQCPEQFLCGMEGTHVAEGSNVPQDELYDVHIRGHDGTIISELVIKRPLDPESEGIYQCEAWPHIHNGGYPYGPYPPFTPPRSDVFIIGSNSLLENCYHICGFTPATSKLGNKNNKQSIANNDEDTKVKQNLVFKPRRNVTESRKDSNSKQLRYNLKYIDNTIYNVDGVNVTAEYFRPSKNNPLNLSRLPNNEPKGIIQKYQNNFSTSVFDFTGRSNDKFRDVVSKFNSRKGRIPNSNVNSSLNKQENS